MSQLNDDNDDNRETYHCDTTDDGHEDICDSADDCFDGSTNSGEDGALEERHRPVSTTIQACVKPQARLTIV